jgi:hypothetical protein
MAACDICGKDINWEDGYILTTRQVTTSDGYWQHTLNKLSVMDANGDTLAASVKQIAGQSSGWLTCEACSALFTFDRVVAKKYAAQKQGNPPEAGSTNAEAAAQTAAKVWKKLFGKWPSSIKMEDHSLPPQHNTESVSKQPDNKSATNKSQSNPVTDNLSITIWSPENITTLSNESNRTQGANLVQILMNHLNAHSEQVPNNIGKELASGGLNIHEFSISRNDVKGGSDVKFTFTKSNKASSSKKDSGCFVATVAFSEDHNCSELIVLREYRDHILRKKLMGRYFISFYYRIGPIAAKCLSLSPKCRNAVKHCIKAMIPWCKSQLEDYAFPPKI